MNRALIIKELRECAPVAALAALAGAWFVWIFTGGPPLPGDTGSVADVPFVTDSFSGPLLMVAGALAVALGLKQTVLEDLLGTYRYLLHRPVERRRVFVLKALVGLALVQAIGAAMILAYALWAARPGTHASPFFWSMTAPAWKAWMVLPLIYLGAAISGLRPARWYASRLLPLVGSGLVAVASFALPWWWMTALGMLITSAVMLASLLYVANARDF
jgi:hypothetical protein